MEPSRATKCALCPNETYMDYKICQECSRRISEATTFNGHNYQVPKRYAAADGTGQKEMEMGEGRLFLGPAGSGKTWRSYGILREWTKRDRRVSVAAYSWPEVLWTLRQGYGNEALAERGREVVQALRFADVAFMDDLGAENITDSNSGWLQETLFVILDHRWNAVKSTILTTNKDPEGLADYLGDRLASRVLGMCKVIKLDGKDRRL